MPIPSGSIPFSGQIHPTDTSDTYPLLEDTHLKGSYRVVASLVERDAIPDERRKEGMAVFVLSENSEYRLIGGILNANWISSSGGNPFVVGNGVDETIDIIFDSGRGVGNAVIRYNHLTQKLQLSHDGITFSDMVALNDVIKYSIVFGG